MLKRASIAAIAVAMIAFAGLAAAGTGAGRLSLVAFLTMAHFCFSYVLGQYAENRPDYTPAGWLFLGASCVAATGLFTRVTALGSPGLVEAGSNMAALSHLAFTGGGVLAALGWTWIAVITVPRWLRNKAPAQ
jgi:hypothetical protein